MIDNRTYRVLQSGVMEGYSFPSGINVIYGRNFTGKSSIVGFLRNSAVISFSLDGRFRIDLSSFYGRSFVRDLYDPVSVERLGSSGYRFNVVCDCIDQFLDYENMTKLASIIEDIANKKQNVYVTTRNPMFLNILGDVVKTPMNMHHVSRTDEGYFITTHEVLTPKLGDSYSCASEHSTDCDSNG